MPYIKQEHRKQIAEVLDPVVDFVCDEKLLAMPGPLNYIITTLCHAYLQGNGYCNYAGMNEVVGVLESVKAELQRTVIAPYEDKKRKENGPISKLDDNRMENLR